MIRETLLPKGIPILDGWGLSAFWQPAREVSGDFYDFIFLPDNRLGVLVADVTDKGVPAAMVMATSRSILRGAAERLVEPGEVLARANDLLHPDIPPKMFVTCLYLVIEPDSGLIQFANAGHNLPYLRTTDGVIELRATGMPLGLMPGMDYEQKEVRIDPGQSILLSSDGIVEAHNTEKEMFGFPRLQQKMFNHPGGEELIPYLMASLETFVGEDHEQEDDITLVMIQRKEAAAAGAGQKDAVLGAFQIPSAVGNERDAAKQVVDLVMQANFPESRLKKLETAVAEATMNAMEHGNKYDPEKMVDIEVSSGEGRLIIRISDKGGGAAIPETTAPDLDAKLSGDQSPRGWGLFLIKNMVDEMNLIPAEGKHTIELVFMLDAA